MNERDASADAELTILSAEETGTMQGRTSSADFYALRASHEALRAELRGVRAVLHEAQQRLRAGVSPQPETGDAAYWYERAERLDRERADWKRWCEERETTIEQLQARSPQPEITRQQIHAAITCDWDAPGPYAEQVTDRVWALLADGATPAGPEPVGMEPPGVVIDDPPCTCGRAPGGELTYMDPRCPTHVGATPAEDDQP